MNVIFVEGVDEFICRSHREYRGSNTQSNIADPAFKPKMLLAILKGSTIPSLTGCQYAIATQFGRRSWHKQAASNVD